MVHHGAGTALFVPMSSKDLAPPCAGFFDRNGDWNLITNISSNPRAQRKGYLPLAEQATVVTSVNIKWQPKCSSGVTEHSLDTSAHTPDNVAGGADAHVKYTSSSKFGAVLITRHPVTLHAYHQERLFLQWLDSNRRMLYLENGSQLKKYGLWIITKTFSAPGCSITAWADDAKDALVSVKAKASMLGELGTTLSLEDTVMDKDWSHYDAASSDDSVVVFVDGIKIASSDWFWEGVKLGLPTFVSRSSSRRNSSRRNSSRGSSAHATQDARRDFSNGATLIPDVEKQPDQYLAVPYCEGPRPTSMAYDLEKQSRLSHIYDDGDEIPADAGPLHLSRASSVRRPSSVVSSLSSRPQSLRRETRSVSEGKIQDGHAPVP